MAAKLLWNFFDWAVLKAMWDGDAETCRQGDGACWAYVREKARYVLFGHYPYEEQWRPQLFVAIFFLLSLLTQFKRFWSQYLTMAWVVLPLGAAVLMWGGFLGLPHVEMEEWGGLPLTLALAFLGISASYPIGIVLALARRSEMPIIRALSVIYIEVIRGCAADQFVVHGSGDVPFVFARRRDHQQGGGARRWQLSCLLRLIWRRWCAVVYSPCRKDSMRQPMPLA